MHLVPQAQPTRLLRTQVSDYPSCMSLWRSISLFRDGLSYFARNIGSRACLKILYFPPGLPAIAKVMDKTWETVQQKSKITVHHASYKEDCRDKCTKLCFTFFHILSSFH